MDRAEVIAFGLRIPAALRSWIAEQAEVEDRSMNYVINKILQEKKEIADARATKIPKK